MGIDAESSDISERIRKRAEENPRIEVTKIGAPPPPAQAVTPVAEAAVSPIPRSPSEWEVRRARFDELVASGLSGEDAEAALESESATAARTATRSRQRSVKHADFVVAVDRIDRLAEAHNHEVDRLDTIAQQLDERIAKLAERADTADEALALLTKLLAVRDERVEPVFDASDMTLSPVPASAFTHVVIGRTPSRFWRTRLGLAVSWPGRMLWRGVRWLTVDEKETT